MPIKEKLWNKDFIIAGVSNFLIACSFYLLMPTIPIYLSEELNIATSKIGIALSSYVIALLIIRPFSGYWVDIYSRKPLYLLGVILFVLTFIGYYFAATVLFFFVLRFVHGLFWGLTSVSSNTVAIDIIPSSRRAEGIGFFGVNRNIAMSIAPFIAVNIYDVFGFNMLITAALIMGGLAIIAVALIRVPERKKLEHTPPISFDRFILVRGIPIFINQIFMAFGYGVLAAYAVLYGKEINISNAGIFFLFFASGIILSRVGTGKLIDRGYLHKVMMVAISFLTIGFLIFALFHNIYFYCGAAFVLGLGFGTLFPGLQTIYINMAPASKRGTANSTYLTGFSLGIGIGILCGAFIEEYFGFSKLYLFAAVLSLIALLIYRYNSIKVYEKNKISSTD